MHYYLSGWTTDRHGYRPVLDTPGWAVIDLRPDATRPDGLCLLATAERPGRDRGGMYLGEEPKGTLPARVASRLANMLGLNLAAHRFRSQVLELLTEHARTDGTRWRPLRPGRNGWELHLGGLLWRAPRTAGGAAYAETFTGTDNTSIQAATINQTWTDVVAGWGVQSNQGYMSSSGAVAYARAAAASATSDTFTQFTLVTKTDDVGDFSQAGACTRFAAAANTSYMATRGQDTANEFNLRKTEAGARSTLYFSTQSLALPEVVRCDASGSTINGLLGGVIVVAITDTSIPTGTQGGLYGYRPTGTQSVVIDNWSFGDLTKIAPPVIRPGAAVHHAAALF